MTSARGIILAAGRGSRMGDLTADHPKCLTPLGGKSLLEWQIEALSRAGAVPIALVGGYRADLLLHRTGTAFINPRWAETNMVMSLVCAESWLTAGTCVVSYSDIVYHSDAVRNLIHTSGDLVITYDRCWHALWSERFEDPLSDAETFRVDESGALLEIGGRPESLEEVGGQYMGLLKFTPAGWSQVRTLLDRLPSASQDRLDMTSMLRLLLKEGVRISTTPIDGHWCEVDSERDLRLYERMLNSSEHWAHDWCTS